MDTAAKQLMERNKKVIESLLYCVVNIAYLFVDMEMMVMIWAK